VGSVEALEEAQGAANLDLLREDGAFLIDRLTGDEPIL